MRNAPEPLHICRSAATTHPPDKRRHSSAAIPAPATGSGRFPSFPGCRSPAPSSASAFQGRASGAQRELLLLSHGRSRTLSRPGRVPVLHDPGWNFTAKALPSQDRRSLTWALSAAARSWRSRAPGRQERSRPCCRAGTFGLRAVQPENRITFPEHSR